MRRRFGILRGVVFAVVMVVGGRGGWAADWFVAVGAAGGDGTKGKPFHDVWRGVEAAASGDTVHVAQGVYFGRYDRSAWVLDRPRVTILGGYDVGFTRRDPWKQPSVLAFYREYEGSSENNLVAGRGDHTGVVIDGLVIDGAGRSLYEEKSPYGLRRGMLSAGALLSLSSEDVVIRNCVLINSTAGAVELSGEGSVFENNIVMNHLGAAMVSLREKNRSTKRPMVVRGNTFAFAHDETDPPMGKGGERGVAIRLGAAAVVEKNVFVGCGNAGINLYAKAEEVSIDGNVFWLNMRGAVVSKEGGKELLITEKNLDEMEDLGFKSSKGNKAADVGLTGLNKGWVEGVTRQMYLNYATPPREGLLALRTRYGVGEVAKPEGEDRGPSAPRLEAMDAGAVTVEEEAGARAVALPVTFDGAAAAARAVTYVPMTWAELNGGAPGLEGKAVEVLVAMGQERNGFVKSGITQEKYVGFEVMYPGGERFPETMHMYAVRNGAAHRQFEEANKSNNAREAEDWYLLRGVARLTGARQKATIEVESIVPGEAPVKAAAVRPKGREWFVKAGSSGGDGSREKPWRDLFQALEKAGDGDVMRVAGGEYFGKLRTANWQIANKYLTILGGYDGEFKGRDPWKNPTRLVMSPDVEKKDRAGHSGQFLQSSEICSGLILDGLVFDGGSINAYFEGGGGLDLGRSTFAPLLQLHGEDVTVRNCVFVNANGGAAQFGSASGVFENNVVVNSSGTGVSVNAMGAGPWVFKGNTFLFAADPTSRAGTGMTSAGSLLLVSGRAAVRIEGNIFGFADNTAVRVTTPRGKLKMDGNVFAGNLFAHFTDLSRVWLFDQVWERRVADAGFGSARENVVALPAGMPVEKGFADKVLPRLFELKGKVPREQWVALAGAVGATAVPAAETAEVVVVAEKPKEEKKELSIDDLLGELNKLKQESAPATTAPKGAPYCPMYPWKAAVDLVQEGAGVGARRVAVGG